MKRFFLAALIGMLIGNLAFSASTDVKSQIGVQDLKLDDDGAAHGTFQRRTSTGGLLTLDKIDGNQIPWSLDYSRTIRPGDIITRGPRTDLRSYLPTNYVTDGSVSYDAQIHSWVDNAAVGAKLTIPAGVFVYSTELSFAGKSHITIEGNNMFKSILQYDPPSSGTRSAFSLLGASYITMRDFEIYSADSTNPPKAIFQLGRTSSGSFGAHRIERVSIRGYAAQAAIYSIASEENSWTNVWAELDGGGGKYVFYTSGADDLGLTGFTSSTNLSQWFNHFRFLNYSDQSNSATIYIMAAASNGDIVFRDGYLAESSTSGSFVEFGIHSSSGAGNYTFSNIRAESTGPAIPNGFHITTTGGGTSLSRLRVEDCFFYPNAYFIYADNNVNVVNSTFINNHVGSTGAGEVISSFYTGSYLTFIENYNNIEFRNTINGGFVVMMNPGYTFNGGTNPQYVIQDNFSRIRNIKQNLPTGATPSVQYGNLYHTANGGATAITNLTNGSLSQEITIICQDTVTSMTDNTSAGLTLNGNFSCTTVGNTIRLINDGTAWRELSRSVN